MLTLSDITGRIRTQYESASGGSSTRWSDDRIAKFIVEGLQSLAESTLFYERHISIPLANGRTYYNLRGFTPETVVRINSIYNTVRTSWLDSANMLHLPYKWEDSTGAPQVYFTRGAHWFGVWPKPTTSTDTDGYLRVYFAGIPHKLTHPQYVLEQMPDSFAPALEDFVLSEMAAVDGRSKQSIERFKSYLRREKSFEQFVDHRETSGSVRMMSSVGGYR